MRQDASLAAALKQFRFSVRAWSDAAQSHAGPVRAAKVARGWRPAVVWVLGCVLTLSVAGGGVYRFEHQRELARIAAAKAAQQQLVEQRERETEDLLARVDSDVSREVPDAMEPLARLMAEDDGR